MQRVLLVALVAVALVAAPALHAQQAPARKPPRAGQTIVIHGQVPTPQVVTVRPREVPQYSRQVLGQDVEHDSFWDALTTPYQLVARGQVTGHLPIDSAAAVVAGGPPLDLQSQTAQMEAMRSELAQRRARLDSLQAASRVAAERQQAADSATRAANARASAADSASRAAEIEALQQELARRRAKLDSLQAVVKSIKAPRDTTAPPDSARPQKP